MIPIEKQPNSGRSQVEDVKRGVEEYFQARFKRGPGREWRNECPGRLALAPARSFVAVVELANATVVKIETVYEHLFRNTQTLWHWQSGHVFVQTSKRDARQSGMFFKLNKNISIYLSKN